jgi:hypothetical protein
MKKDSMKPVKGDKKISKNGKDEAKKDKVLGAKKGVEKMKSGGKVKTE